MYKRNADSKSDLVISYLTLRKVIGILGMSFPAILALGARRFYGIPLVNKIFKIQARLLEAIIRFARSVGNSIRSL